MQRNLKIICLLLLAPLFSNGQLYWWATQAWQERDLVNPAALHELNPASPYRFLAGISFRYKQFADHPSNGQLDDWWNAAFRIEYLTDRKKENGGNWLLGGRFYKDQFGATELTHGSLRLGWRQILSSGGHQSTLTAAFRLGMESFQLNTGELYFLQPNDPLQNGILSSSYLVGGAGIFYQIQQVGKAWGFNLGLSLPAILHPDLISDSEGKYRGRADLRELHGLLGGFARIGNGQWMEWSAWGKVQQEENQEGSLSLRYFQKFEVNKTAHSCVLWAGAGGSTYGYLHLEAGLLYDHVKIGFGYDWWRSPVAPVHNIPLQLTLAWVGVSNE